MGIMGWDDISAFLVRKAFPDFKDNSAIFRDVPSSKERITVAYKKFEQEGRLSDFYKYFGQGMIPNQKVFESKENKSMVYYRQKIRIFGSIGECSDRWLCIKRHR